MRGGFVACLRPSGPHASRLETAVSSLKWHTGDPSVHRLGGLEVACLADPLHGPAVEVRNGRLLLCHGGPAEPLDRLERRPRFVGIESDGSRLRAIRDRMGEVPLFYRRVGDELWLATEIHPLLAIAPAEPDLEWLTAFCAMVEHSETTGWQGIKRALPGEILHVDRELRVTSQRYFSPGCGSTPRSAPAARGGGLEDSRAVLRRRGKPRLVRGAGVLLSGGLDSSAVALVAAETTRPTLLTITHPGIPKVDETSYAHTVAAAAGLPLAAIEVEPDAWDPAADIQTFGVPPLGGPTGMYERGLQALTAAGCDIALDGHDGDGTLGGLYAWSANTLLDGRLDRLALAARQEGALFVLQDVVDDVLSPSLKARLRRRRVSSSDRRSFLPYFRGNSAARLGLYVRWQGPRRGWERAQLRPLLPPTTQYFEEFETLGARAGIDVQHPFADRDLIDFVLTLPHAAKESRMRLKPLLRDALADVLPQVVADRDDKTEFSAVLDARVDFDAAYRTIRDSGVRLPDLDYGRLFRDAARPINNRVLWTRLVSAHVFLAGSRSVSSQSSPGCHGIAVSPPSLGLELGWLAEPPPLAVEVELQDTVERAPGAELVWQLDEPPGVRVADDHQPDLARAVREPSSGSATRSICPCESTIRATW